MTATLSKNQAELPRLVEIASQGEAVVITVEGKPKARLTRASMAPGKAALPRQPVDLMVRVKGLASVRDKYCTVKPGFTVDQILKETRADCR